MTAVLADGQRVHLRIEHAIGSLQRPLSDAQLDAKFAALVEPVLGAAKAGAIAEKCRALGALPDVHELIAMCRP